MTIKMRSKMHENKKWIYHHFSFWNSSRMQMLKFTCSKIRFFHEINVFGSNSNSIPGSVQNQVGFAIDNCSDPYRIQKMHVFWSDLPPGSVQNDARKWWNTNIEKNDTAPFYAPAPTPNAHSSVESTKTDLPIPQNFTGDTSEVPPGMLFLKSERK